MSAEIDGERLSDEAIYSFLRLLLPAGLETTYRSSGNLLFHLLTHPEQFRAVQADRELIGPAIEEGLRFETPLTTVQRYAAEETEIEGVTLPKGAVIDVCIGSANRDGSLRDRDDPAARCRRIVDHLDTADQRRRPAACGAARGPDHPRPARLGRHSPGDRRRRRDH